MFLSAIIDKHAIPLRLSLSIPNLCFCRQLHKNGYDTGMSLQALVKTINPKSIEKRWSEEDAVSNHSFTSVSKRCSSIAVLMYHDLNKT